jgi:hypothetical protein
MSQFEQVQLSEVPRRRKKRNGRKQGMDTFDFDTAVVRLVELTDRQLIRRELITIWNARGAADVAKLEALIDGREPPTVKVLGAWIRQLDC